MKSTKKYFLLLIILSVFLFGAIYAKNAVAGWKNDHRNPEITITATCSNGTPITSGGTCKGASATITITYFDTAPNDSGLKTISHTLNDVTDGINFATPRTTPYIYTYTGSEVNNITSGQYDVRASATDAAGNIVNYTDGIDFEFTFDFLYSVKGAVFFDNNSNGLFESGETAYNLGSIIVAITGHTTPPTNDGTYKIDDLVAGTYTINQITPSGYSNTIPAPSSYSIIVGPTALPCNDGDGVPGRYSPNVNPSGEKLDATCTIGFSIENLNFGISKVFPWFQGTGGDIRIDSSIGGGPGFNDSLPSSGNNCGGSDYPSNYASIYDRSAPPPDTDFSNSPGVIFSGDPNPLVFANFGSGQASTENWYVGNTQTSTWPETFKPVRPGVIRTSYNYYATTIRQNGTPTTPLSSAQCGVGDISNCTLPANLPNGAYIADTDGVYSKDTNVTLNSWTPTNGNYLFLIDGDLTINGDIKIKVGSTATFSVSGNIIVDKNVGAPLANCNETDQSRCICDVTREDQRYCNIEGFYSTDNSFIINNKAADSPNSGNVCGSVGGAQKDLRLNIAGSIVVNAGLNQTPGTLKNNRDLCNGNAICPAFAIIERPDFILNAPDLIKHPNFVWQEIAP
ncbi:MAG: hypothetical protein Q7K55_06990 [Candidatus Levybacteria bacterium]|nr:hypothetical protein [Candidatus Levybacteria bacterium]